MTMKQRLSAIGNGTLSGLHIAATALNNGPIRDRMREIDEEMEKLQKERDELERKLMTPHKF